MTLPKPPGSENDPIRISPPIPTQFLRPLANVVCKYYFSFYVTHGNVSCCLGHRLLLKPPTHSPHYPPPFKTLPSPLLHVPARGVCRRLIPMNLQSKNLGAWTGSRRNKQSRTLYHSLPLRLIMTRSITGFLPSLHRPPRTTQSLTPSISNFSTLRPSSPANPLASLRLTVYLPPTMTYHVPQMPPSCRWIRVQTSPNNEMRAQILPLQLPVKAKRNPVLLRGRTSSTLNSRAIHPHHHR